MVFDRTDSSLQTPDPQTKALQISHLPRASCECDSLWQHLIYLISYDLFQIHWTFSDSYRYQVWIGFWAL